MDPIIGALISLCLEQTGEFQESLQFDFVLSHHIEDKLEMILGGKGIEFI